MPDCKVPGNGVELCVRQVDQFVWDCKLKLAVTIACLRLAYPTCLSLTFTTRCLPSTVPPDVK